MVDMPPAPKKPRLEAGTGTAEQAADNSAFRFCVLADTQLGMADTFGLPDGYKVRGGVVTVA